MKSSTKWSLAVLVAIGGICSTLPLTNPHKQLSADTLQLRISTNQSNKLGLLLSQSCSVCFIGDSVSVAAGSENGNHPWYEPLIKAFPHIQVENIVVGGGTSKLLLRISETKLKAHPLYIIVQGANDVQYRAPEKGAIASEEYISNLSSIIALTREPSLEVHFICIAPWFSISEAPVPPISREKKEELLAESPQTMCDYCDPKRHLFINPPNPIL